MDTRLRPHRRGAITLVVTSAAADATRALPALASMQATVSAAHPDDLAAVVERRPDAVLVDARADLATARDSSLALNEANPDLPQLAVMDVGGLVTLPTGWALTDFLLRTATGAEVQARLRRATGQRPVVFTDDQVAGAHPPVELDETRSSARIGQAEIPLTDVEFRLLSVLSTEPDRVFSRARLVEQVWDGRSLPDTASVGVHIARVRRKLGEHAELIRTVRKVGYQLTAST